MLIETNGSFAPVDRKEIVQTHVGGKKKQMRQKKKQKVCRNDDQTTDENNNSRNWNDKEHWSSTEAKRYLNEALNLQAIQLSYHEEQQS